MIQTTTERAYIAPEIEEVDIDLQNLIATSNLESPGDGDEYPWD